MAASEPDLEIERKFLVSGAWPMAAAVLSIRQIYINPGASISVRLRECDGAFSFTLKKGRTALVRSEYNVEIEAAQGARMMAEFGSSGMIEKQRHQLPAGDIVWEVDVFAGANSGLIIAEVELVHEAQAFSKPDWLGREVSHDPRFTNHALFRNPFSRWGVSYANLLSSSD
jgi:adenylate cyclase